MKVIAAVVFLLCSVACAGEADEKELLKQGEAERLATIDLYWKSKTYAPTVLSKLMASKGKYLPTLKLTEGSVGVFQYYTVGPVKEGGIAVKSSDNHIGYSFCGRRAEVVEVIDDKNMVVDWRTEKVWIQNYKTANLVDGKPVEPDGLFKYVGTKKWNGKTIYLIEKIPDPETK